MTTRQSEFWAGMRATIPLVIGAFPFGMIFGALAVTSGLSALGASAMSALVFAGSAQFLATGLIKDGVTTGLIVLITLVVNLRHALYSATLAPHMKHLPQRWLALLGFALTDESFVVVIERYNQPDTTPYKHWFFLGSVLIMYVNWSLWTFVGVRAGAAIRNPESWGLDFALSVTFIGMVVPMIKDRAVAACVAVAAISALLFAVLPYQLGLIVATLLAVCAGMLVERKN
jgi:4-azaleucine resistance transporter AzlC